MAHFIVDEMIHNAPNPDVNLALSALKGPTGNVATSVILGEFLENRELNRLAGFEVATQVSKLLRPLRFALIKEFQTGSRPPERNQEAHGTRAANVVDIRTRRSPKIRSAPRRRH
jgi:hypothetical protein